MEGIQMYQAQILLRQGYSRSTVAEILGVTRRTIYNYEKRVVFKENTRHGSSCREVKTNSILLSN